MGRIPVNITISGIFFLISLYISGCGTLGNLGLVNQNYEPGKGLGSPTSTGLVVLDCRVLYNPSHEGNILASDEFLADAGADGIEGYEEIWEVRGAHLEDENGHWIYGKSFKLNHLPHHTEKLVIFSSVEPGKYRLAQIEVTYREKGTERVFDYDQGEYFDQDVIYYDSAMLYIPADTIEELSVEVMPGKIQYLGLLTIIDEHEVREKIQYLYQYDPSREILCYRKLTGWYKESPWVNIWKERINELDALYPKE